MSLKYSKQREEIITFLKDRKNPHISLGTVYRNLNLLADRGEILRLRLNDGVEHFDADTSPHYHFVCTECKSVMDLNMTNIESITKIAGADFDGRIAGHVTYFYGTCGNCLRKSPTDKSFDEECLL